MRKLLFPVALALGLMFLPATVHASWLSQALHPWGAAQPVVTYVPGYSYYYPGYTYVTPGYPNLYWSSPYWYRTYRYPRYYGNWHSWYGHHWNGHHWHHHW